jgi:hypothetical protein
VAKDDDLALLRCVSNALKKRPIVYQKYWFNLGNILTVP